MGKAGENMDWMQRINRVMDYVEEHLRDEMDEEEISRIIACPYQNFQSLFGQVTNISFSEYIRRRKLTMAAYDLQNSDEKVMDIALKYGYQSGDAFRVAFRKMHGVNPTEVRQNAVPLMFYCRLEFQVTVKGVESMKYTIEEKEAFKVLGTRMTTPYGGGTWAVVKSDGTNEKMREISGDFFDLGLCFGFQEDGSNDYMCAVLWDGPETEGFVTYEYPPATWLIFRTKGKISDNVLGNLWRQINQEFLPQSQYAKCGLPTIEKYIFWNEAEDLGEVEVWIPVK
nr:AraC family transcriptional regulator [Blautia coccoides]